MLLVESRIPRVKKARADSGMGRQTRRESEVTEPHVREAAGRGTRSRASVVNDDTSQTSVAALMLDQLMDAVGVRVRQELMAQAATPYQPQLGQSSGSSGMPYLLEPPGGYPTPTTQRAAVASCWSMPVPASTASASGNDVAIGNPMPAVLSSEFTSF